MMMMMMMMILCIERKSAFHGDEGHMLLIWSVSGVVKVNSFKRIFMFNHLTE